MLKPSTRLGYPAATFVFLAITCHFSLPIFSAQHQAGGPETKKKEARASGTVRSQGRAGERARTGYRQWSQQC